MSVYLLPQELATAHVLANPNRSARGQRVRTHIVPRTVRWNDEYSNNPSSKALCGATPGSGYKTVGVDFYVRDEDMCPRCIRYALDHMPKQGTEK